MVLLAFSLMGSLLVSYTRARAEAVQIECKEGFFQRTERIVVLILGLVTGWMLPVLWLLAIFTNITALQRIYDVYRKTNQSTVSAALAAAIALRCACVQQRLPCQLCSKLERIFSSRLASSCSRACSTVAVTLKPCRSARRAKKVACCCHAI